MLMFRLHGNPRFSADRYSSLRHMTLMDWASRQYGYSAESFCRRYGR